MPDASPVWIKICGLREVETAVCAAELGADAIGINFFSGSPRCVGDVGTAKQIVEALPETTQAVGVFVNHSAEEILGICAQTGLTMVQLHGDEPEALIGELDGYRVIRALRLADDVAEEAASPLASNAPSQPAPWAWLVDAHVPGAYGGTGETVDWTRLAPQQRDKSWPPLILAGGLTPENVAEAIATVRPWGVDVASGVESEPGVKDLPRVDRFIRACRS